VGVTCGRIAESHHWTIEQVERELGAQGRVPLPDGEEGDLGYVAALLRVIDYAHINRDRASTLERLFRPKMIDDSLVHWLAQENIDGPVRDGSELAYRASASISNIDSWWLYYEMLKGLNDEITIVRRYLARREWSKSRFSLQGVRGANSPEETAVLIPTSGFLPIEINLKTGSIERLVSLLAGESLYGPDPMSAVRELLQNARDAVLLKASIANTDIEKAALTIPIRLTMSRGVDCDVLEVTDHGVGMTRKVITDYLLSIASDYWRTQFYTDFPDAYSLGFRPAGRFGIGFLSVFMLGDDITVNSNREGGERCILDLRGVGRRGEIRSDRNVSGSGTAVRVKLRPASAQAIQTLDELVRVYAPMLPHAIEINVYGRVTTLGENWLMSLGEKEFLEWVGQVFSYEGRLKPTADRDHGLRFSAAMRYTRLITTEDIDSTDKWLAGRPCYQTKDVRLYASDRHNGSLHCLKGLAVKPIYTPGFTGVINLVEGTPDVSRRDVADANVSSVLAEAKRAIKSQVIENIERLATSGLTIDKNEFLTMCSKTYGAETVREARLPWLSLLVRPGEVDLVDCSGLLTRLAGTSSIFISYGTGPWTALKQWVASSPQADTDSIAIVMGTTRRNRLEYVGEERSGTLIELWPDLEDDSLFGIVVQLVCEAWQIRMEDIVKQDSWRHNSNNVFGYMIRQ
jgi:hypothetical protein